MDDLVLDPETAELLRQGIASDPSGSYTSRYTRQMRLRLRAGGSRVGRGATGGPTLGGAPSAAPGTLRNPDQVAARASQLAAVLRGAGIDDALTASLLGALGNQVDLFGFGGFGGNLGSRTAGLNMDFDHLGDGGFGHDSLGLVSEHGQGRDGYNAYTMRGPNAGSRGHSDSDDRSPPTDSSAGGPGSSHASEPTTGSSSGWFDAAVNAAGAAVHSAWIRFFGDGGSGGGSAAQAAADAGPAASGPDGGRGAEESPAERYERNRQVQQDLGCALLGCDEDEREEIGLDYDQATMPSQAPTEDPHLPYDPDAAGPSGGWSGVGLPHYLAPQLRQEFRRSVGPGLDRRESPTRPLGRRPSIPLADEPSQAEVALAQLAETLRKLRTMPGPGRDPRRQAEFAAFGAGGLASGVLGTARREP